MKFLGVLKQRACGISRGQLKKVEFPGVFTRKTHLEFPWVLVFDLEIAKGLFSPKFLRVKSQI